MERKKPYSALLLFAAGKRSLQVFSKTSAVSWQNWNYQQGTTARQQDKSVLLQNDLEWWNNLIDCAAGLYQPTWLHVPFPLPFSLHPESKASSKLLSLVEQTFFFLYNGNQNRCLFCYLTSFAFLRNMCRLTSFMA